MRDYCGSCYGNCHNIIRASCACTHAVISDSLVYQLITDAFISFTDSTIFYAVDIRVRPNGRDEIHVQLVVQVHLKFHSCNIILYYLLLFRLLILQE